MRRPALDPVLDLALGSACVVCARPGRTLCGGCRRRLPEAPTERRPSPCPPGLACAVATGSYEGDLRTILNAHKEQARFTLAGPIGDLLAASVAALSAASGAPGAPGHDGRVLRLVPVPSRRASVRSRGHDPLLRVVRRAASSLRRAGLAAVVVPWLRPSRAVLDQAGLGARERRANLAGSMRLARGVGPLRRPGAPADLVVVDDVLTTGWTAREAQRVLEEAGGAVLGIAVVAATRRRVDDSRPSLPF